MPQPNDNRLVNDDHILGAALVIVLLVLHKLLSWMYGGSDEEEPKALTITIPQ